MLGVLREDLTAHGITHAELARRMGVSAPAMSYRLSGQVHMSFDLFEAVCEAADLDPRDVLRKVTGGYQGWVAA